MLYRVSGCSQSLKVDQFPICLCSVDMFVHQKWFEPRLELPEVWFEDGDDYVTLPPEFFDNLWQPDPYFLNSKVAGNLTFNQDHVGFMGLFLPDPLSLSISLVPRNCNLNTQVFLGDALPEQDGALCRQDVRHHGLPDGVPALPHGHSDLSHLYREL